MSQLFRDLSRSHTVAIGHAYPTKSPERRPSSYGGTNVESDKISDDPKRSAACSKGIASNLLELASLACRSHRHIRFLREIVVSNGATGSAPYSLHIEFRDRLECGPALHCHRQQD